MVRDDLKSGQTSGARLVATPEDSSLKVIAKSLLHRAVVGNQAVSADVLSLANCSFDPVTLHPFAGLARVVLVVADFKGIRDG